MRKTAFMRSWLGDQRGASSVLCIFMMIVMIVFGTLALTSSYANLSLARRTVKSNADNYALDHDGEAAYARVDAALAQAELSARESLVTLSFGGTVGIPDEQSARNALQHSKSQNDTSIADDWLNRLYFYYAHQALSALAPALGAGITGQLTCREEGVAAASDFLADSRDLAAGAMTLSINISRGSEVCAKQLTIDFGVLPLTYELEYTVAGLGGRRAMPSPDRTGILAWRHWQIPFEYDDSLGFDGVLLVD